MASARSASYNGGLGAEPPLESSNRAPNQGVRGLEAESLLAVQHEMKAAKFTAFTVSVFSKLSVNFVMHWHT